MEPAADPAVTVVFWSKDRGFQLREALASLRRHARFGARPAALRVVVLWRAAAARRAAYARVIEEAAGWGHATDSAAAMRVEWVEEEDGRLADQLRAALGIGAGDDDAADPSDDDDAAFESLEVDCYSADESRLFLSLSLSRSVSQARARARIP